MIDLFRDIILAASGLMVLVVLRRSSNQNNRVPNHVWPFLMIGFMLLLMGRVLEMLDAWGMIVAPLARVLVQEVLGFCLGFAILALGCVRWVNGPSTRPQRREQRRQQRGTQGRTQRRTQRRAQREPRRAASGQPIIVAADNGGSEMLTSILKCSLAGVMVLKAQRDETQEIVDYKVDLMNEAAEQILGRSSSYLVGRDLLQEFPCIKAEGLLGDTVSVIETGLPYKNERLFTQGRDGRWYQFVAVKLRDGLAVTFADVSDRKRAEEQLRHAAHHDTLTGLPNRALFTERLEQALNRAKRFPDYKFAILFLDFDRFKIINDSLGHEAGDQLLIGIAERLRTNLRGLDMPSRMNEEHMPARLGGDEFVILLDNIHDILDVVRVAERLQIELGVPHNLAGHDVVSTASIGIVTSDIGYDNCDDIIRDADTAMYRAKTSGKARHVVFDDRMHQEVVQRLDLERELREAVEKERFSLEFEPIVGLSTGKVNGLEALIRWPHPTRGLLAPSDFLALADELNLVVPIGEWVLRAACEQLEKWHEKFPGCNDVAVHVNLARPQLLHPDMLPHVKKVLSETGLAPKAVCLEVTEAMIMDDIASTTTVFNQLEEVGIRLVMDDFGTGNSSLSCLHRFPIDILKIDRDFLSSVRKRRDYGAIVHAVVELAHNLGMEVVAEGVETQDQLALLQALDCDFAQGHLFSKAMSAEQVEELLGNDARFKTAA